MKLKRLAKHISYFNRIFIKKHPLAFDMYRLERSISPATRGNHSKVLKVINNIDVTKDLADNFKDSVVDYGQKKRKELLDLFRNKYSYVQTKVLVHVQTKELAVAGVSAHRNLILGLQYLGIEAQEISIEENFEKKFFDFQPDIFISADTKYFKQHIELDAIKKYREKKELVTVLGLLGDYTEKTFQDSLKYWNDLEVTMLSSFNCIEFVRDKFSYIIDEGYKIISLEFAANPLIHFPEPVEDKELDFVFLGSLNKSKWNRYLRYFKPIFTNESGFINGPGWIEFDEKTDFEQDRYIYSRAKVALNLSIDIQIESERELNERTFQLAACGVPQLIDNPKLLKKRFSTDSMFIAENEDEYYSLFKFILNHPDEAEKRALNALKEVFEKHTIFHRAEHLLNEVGITGAL